MPERHNLSLEQLSLKYASYWQSVLRFGLPFTILYVVVNYAVFRAAIGNVGLPYPWRSVAIPDVAYMFLASTVWWGLMRQIANWKRKNQKS